MKYLAYFQAYTNTYASLEKLKQMYEEALRVKDIVGIVIGTRPDCVDNALLDYLGQLNKKTFIIVEYGIESANDNTLRRIHRGHNFACSQDAIERTHARGLLTCGHIILGLPGEDAATGSSYLIPSTRLSKNSPITNRKRYCTRYSICKITVPFIHR